MNKKQDIYKITAIVLMLDQFIKIIINHNMKLNTHIDIIPNFFSIFYVRNTGAAFSILEDNTIFLVIISAVFVVLIDRYIKKEEKFSKLGVISLGMIMGGIFGNLIDRIIHHSVIDYLSFTVLEYNFPIFNLADIGITVGVALYILSLILERNTQDDDTKNIRGINNRSKHR